MRNIELRTLGGLLQGDTRLIEFSTILKNLELDEYICTSAIEEYQRCSKEDLYNELTLLKEGVTNLADRLVDIGNKVTIENKYAVDDLCSIRNDIDLLVEEKDETISGKELVELDMTPSFISTASSEFNKLFGDFGFRQGCLYMFSAPPKGGKSLFLLSIANMLSLANPDKSVLYLTLENDLTVTRDRLLTYRNVSPNLRIQFRKDFTINEIYTTSKKYDILVIDHCNRININNSDDNMNMFIAYQKISRALHNAAVKCNNVVITACQTERSVTNTGNINDPEERLLAFSKIGIQNVGQSLAIVQEADVVYTVMYAGGYFFINPIATRISLGCDGLMLGSTSINHPDQGIDLNVSNIIGSIPSLVSGIEARKNKLS